jgi:hypothetical protein
MPLVVGLPLLLFTPHRSPRSFQRKLFKGKAFYFTVYQFFAPPPPPLLLLPHLHALF